LGKSEYEVKLNQPFLFMEQESEPHLNQPHFLVSQLTRLEKELLGKKNAFFGLPKKQNSIFKESIY
jgi:hypothetical protein